MKLYGGQPYWLLRDGAACATDPLPATCDVVVIGSGVTGALIADRLSREGLQVAVIDRRDPSLGSTVASTALLLYQLDAELNQLTATVGRDAATRIYRRVHATIDTLDDLAHQCSEPVGFRRCNSLYLASEESDVSRLRAEADQLRGAGLLARWIEPDELPSPLDGAGHGAIQTSQAAEIDPVALGRALLKMARERGTTVTGKTAVTQIVAGGDGGVAVHTEAGSVLAKWCVSAMGYESPPNVTPPIVELHSSFAFATKPLGAEWADLAGTMIWESKRPYLYLRGTEEGGLLAGGVDLPFSDPVARDALMPDRQVMLEAALRDWFPGRPFEVATTWCGTFAETSDGLPCIGEVPDMPGMLLALCAGGNGIPFAVLAADIVSAHCHGGVDPEASILAVDRDATREMGVQS